MLHTQTVERDTLGLLKELMAMPELNSFVLVGGTNLALKFGHRLSIDLDLFSKESFDTEEIYNVILAKYPKTELVSQSKTMFFTYTNEVKLDFVYLPYPYLEPVEDHDGIRLLSLKDIAAMKFNAISRRGVKKDFWDVAELLDNFTIEQMIGFYKQKYSSHDILHLLRALVYFEDAEKQKDPDPLKKITWKQVKIKVEKAVKKYLDNSL